MKGNAVQSIQYVGLAVLIMSIWVMLSLSIADHYHDTIEDIEFDENHDPTNI